MVGVPWLSALIFWPLPFLLILLLLPYRFARGYRAVALASALGQAVLAFLLMQAYPPGMQTLAFTEQLAWFALAAGKSRIQVNYLLGVDGMSLALLLLSGLILLFATLAADAKMERPKAFYALLLLLGVAVPGCFAAQDGFLFYLFFEMMLIPMYFLVGMWGGPKREFAAIQFFLYTLVGSLFILAAFAIAYLTDNPTGTLTAIARTHNAAWFAPFAGSFSAGELVFWLSLTGFAIKLPVVPLHTWLPPAHVEAQTPVSVILAGILLKTGGYGILRWTLPLSDGIWQQHTGFLAVMGGAGILYAALLALATTDVKRMIALSSVSHMGFVLLGLGAGTAIGVQGAIYQLFSHGLISAGLFIMAGWLGKHVGTRNMQHFSGLAGVAPRFTLFCAAFFFAGMGLPGFSGFVGEFLVLLGAATRLQSTPHLWAFGLAMAGLLATSGFFLWASRRMFMGDWWRHPSVIDARYPMLDVREDRSELETLADIQSSNIEHRTSNFDMTWRAALLPAIILALVIYFGLQPEWLLSRLPLLVP